MALGYTLIDDVAAQVDVPENGTLSRTLYQDEQLKVVLFGFSSGQELSEHTAAVPAVMHFLSGEAEVGLDCDKITARAGTWIRLPAALPHSIHAKTPVTMLLLLLKQPCE